MTKAIFVFRVPCSMMLMGWAICAPAQEPLSADPATNLLTLRAVLVDGRPVSHRAGAELRVGPNLQSLTFVSGAATNSPGVPARLRYKLEGRDAAWCDRPGAEMFLAIRFYDAGRKLTDRKVFSARGESAGWLASLNDSTLTHRRETLMVPPGTAAWDVVISSAGPPDTVGIYVVDDLVVSRLSPTNGPSEILLPPLFEGSSADDFAGQRRSDWVPDGIRPSMAKIVEIGQNPKKRAYAVIDDDPRGHAEWRTRSDSMRRIAPGESLVVEWNEMFSIGHGLAGIPGQEIAANYPNLPPGAYRFCVQEVNVFGVPTGAEAVLAVRVRSPLWATPWFWLAITATLMSGAAVVNRSLASMKMRREVRRLRQLRALEQERLRIAQNIHDDLGARVTQISMLSAMAPDHAGFPENARADFNQISQMSRDLISAMYETVWAVNPENDNLYAVGNFLRQMTSQLCEAARLRCRLHIPTLPREVQVSSQTRHNLTMAVKEAVHNIMKHAKASEASVRVAFADQWLTITIQDDGGGFQNSAGQPGLGLANMKRRMKDLGGSCSVESGPGRGTTVSLRLRLETTKVQS
jgi:signal transduction histidine kinase